MAARTQPVIRANGLVLRPWRPSDRAVVVAAYSDPAIRRWHCRSMSDDEAAGWIAGWAGRWRDETDAGWAILDAGLMDAGPIDGGPIKAGPIKAGRVDYGAVDNGAVDNGPVDNGLTDDGPVGDGPVDALPVVGQFGLRRIDLAEGLAAVSYWVLPGARGRRVAPRALAAGSAWAFATLGLHRVEVSHSTANLASCRVAERAGFPAEGTKRGSALHADGWHDMHLHARLAGDG